MQAKVNEKLIEMDKIVKIVHKGKTLNATNIQLLIKKIDMFCAQILLLNKQLETPTKDNIILNRLNALEQNALASDRNEKNGIDLTGDDP